MSALKTAFEHENDVLKLAFFTNQGGVSKGQYASLNCGYGSDDFPENIRENRRRVADYMLAEEAPLLSVYQYHSTDVVHVSAPWIPENAPKADGMVTTERGLCLGVLSADCGPILFYDTVQKVIGAAHSGWRGAVGGINENMIAAMEQLGAKVEDIHVYLGPMIQQASYEVGQDVVDQVLAVERQDNDVFLETEKEGKYLFDLPHLIEKRLVRCGISQITKIYRDTYIERENFFSFRRNTHENIKDYGRGISVICLK